MMSATSRRLATTRPLPPAILAKLEGLLLDRRARPKGSRRSMVGEFAEPSAIVTELAS